MPPAPTTRLTLIGPAICPRAKAEVSAAISPVARIPPTLRASCMPTIVITMNVPPTNSAASMIGTMPDQTIGSAMPKAMTRWLATQRRRFVTTLRSIAVARVDPIAAAPKSGQDQPKTAGSRMTCLAMTGKKVAGMMYPKPNAP